MHKMIQKQIIKLNFQEFFSIKYILFECFCQYLLLSLSSETISSSLILYNALIHYPK